ATEDEARRTTSTQIRYEGAGSKPKGSPAPNKIEKRSHSDLKKRKILRIGTWNARTIMSKDKLENGKLEMKRMKLNILGMSEVGWKGGGDNFSDDVRVIYA